MSDKNRGQGVFDGDDPAERALWDALGDMPQVEPPASVRRDFHNRLEQASRKNVFQRLQELLGFSSNAGWITATACVLLSSVRTSPSTTATRSP